MDVDVKKRHKKRPKSLDFLALRRKTSNWVIRSQCFLLFLGKQSGWLWGSRGERMLALFTKVAIFYELTNISWVHTTNLLSSEQENKTHLYTHFTDRLTRLRAWFTHPPPPTLTHLTLSRDRKVGEKEHNVPYCARRGKGIFRRRAAFIIFDRQTRHFQFFSANRARSLCWEPGNKAAPLFFCLLMRARSLCRMPSRSLFALQFINFPQARSSVCVCRSGGLTSSRFISHAWCVLEYFVGVRVFNSLNWNNARQTHKRV